MMVSKDPLNYDLTSIPSRVPSELAAQRRKNNTDHHRDRYFAPTEAISMTPDTAPGLPTIGLPSGPRTQTMQDVKDAREQTYFHRLTTDETTAPNYVDEIAATREAAQSVDSLEDIDPVDLTDC